MTQLIALLMTFALATPALAQDAGLPDAMRLAWDDRAPEVDASRNAVVTVALGVADERRGPLTARRLWARRDAETRARAALHAWADGVIARSSLDGATIAAVHRAIDEHASVTATRARIDGSACVEVVVALRDLAAATPSARGLPWTGAAR
jgi:hypothetical protein